MKKLNDESFQRTIWMGRYLERFRNGETPVLRDLQLSTETFNPLDFVHAYPELRFQRVRTTTHLSRLHNIDLFQFMVTNLFNATCKLIGQYEIVFQSVSLHWFVDGEMGILDLYFLGQEKSQDGQK